MKYRDFCLSDNPPNFHGKVTFLLPEYSGHDELARLAAREEEHVRFAELNGSGTRMRWVELLDTKGLALREHELVRRGDTAEARVH